MLDFELHDKGAENLIVAIYERAADDLIAAYIKRKEENAKPIENFFKRNMYGVGIGVGDYIIRKCKDEVELVKNLIFEFYKSNEYVTILKDKDVNKKVVQMYLHEYDFQMKVITSKSENGEYYLVKKKKLRKFKAMMESGYTIEEIKECLEKGE